jgi:hypothetical protein
MADSLSKQGFLIDPKTLHNVKQLHHLNSRDTRKMYCSKVAELFDDYIARWNGKQATGQFSISRRGQMRVGNTSRYSHLKRDQENA